MFRMIVSSRQIKGLSNIFCSSKNRNPSNCIDISSTGVSFYDDFLDPKQQQYLNEKKNLRGHIEMMTPLKYYEVCATKVFRNSSVEALKSQRRRDSESIEYLTNALESGRKFQLPYINLATKGQEGLHRMMVLAEEYGWDTVKFPVLIVEYVDGALEKIKEAKRALHHAVQESLQYFYRESNLPNELISQVQWELEKQDEDTSYTAVLLAENSKFYWISLDGFRNIKEAVDKSELNYTEDSNEEFEDVDIDEELLKMDIDDLLKALK